MINNSSYPQELLVTIRLADERDYPDILSLIREFSLFQQTPEKVTITLEQMIKEKDHFRCLVAVNKKGAIVAFATFFFAYYSWTGKALYLDDLYVTAPFRRQGIGKRFLETLIQQAKEENCYKVRWQVSKWNKNAIEFYKSMGAEIDEVEINCDYKMRPEYQIGK
jgi:GNAT superfamily N-acetyltransferase